MKRHIKSCIINSIVFVPLYTIASLAAYYFNIEISPGAWLIVGFTAILWCGIGNAMMENGK